jgi:hypothetical protein
LAELLEDLIARYGDGGYAESRDCDLGTTLGRQDEHLEAAFRAKAAESPADFGFN